MKEADGTFRRVSETCGFAISALLASTLFSAQGAFAANYDFTGQVDNNWNTAKNWYVENGGAQQTSVPNGKHNLNFRSNATNIKASFKNNPTVNISSKYTACTWKVHVRSLGTESSPVVFNASTDANGLQVGNTTSGDKTGYYIAYDTGDAWLRLQKGTYGTASGGLWYIGCASYQGHVVADSGVTVSSTAASPSPRRRAWTSATAHLTRTGQRFREKSCTSAATATAPMERPTPMRSCA